MLGLAWQADRRSFLLLLATQCLQGLIPLAMAWLTKALFDLLARSLQGSEPASLIQSVVLLLTAQALITLLSQILAPASQYSQARLGRLLPLSIRERIYQKLNTFHGLACFEDPSFHTVIQVAASNAQIGPLQAISVFTSLIQGGVTLLSFLGVLVTLNPLLAAILGLAIFPQFLAQLKLSKQYVVTVIGNSPKERRASYYGQVLSWMNYAKEVRLFNLGEYFLRKFLAISQEIHLAQDRQQQSELRWQSLLSLLSSSISTGSFVFVVIQAFSGRLSLGDVALYTSAVTSTQGALTGIIMALTRLNESLLFFRQYTNLLALREPLGVGPVLRPVPPLAVGITFRNVSFRYSDHQSWILRNVDLFLPASRCLALVGLNGAGKTTLVKLLMRLYDPVEGQILWDNIDLREFDPQEFRQHLGVIFQDFARYDLTVQENIGLGNVAQIENKTLIQQAARKAGIHERVESLPHGYQSMLRRWLAVEQEGLDLSGGEWQKLALARMFMRDTDVLVLDEPTAALDAQTEYDLYCDFRELMRGRTCLLITHRLSTARMADCIAVLEDGCITEYGTHAELLSQAGAYTKLYSLQAQGYQ